MRGLHKLCTLCCTLFEMTLAYWKNSALSWKKAWHSVPKTHLLLNTFKDARKTKGNTRLGSDH